MAKSSTGAVCPCGREAPPNKDFVSLAFRWDDDSIGYYAPCSDPNCKGARSCREAIARLNEWRFRNSAGKPVYSRDSSGKEHFKSRLRYQERYNRRLTAQGNPNAQRSIRAPWEDALIRKLDRDLWLRRLRHFVDSKESLPSDLAEEMRILIFTLRGMSYGEIASVVSPTLLYIWRLWT